MSQAVVLFFECDPRTKGNSLTIRALGKRCPACRKAERIFPAPSKQAVATEARLRSEALRDWGGRPPIAGAIALHLTVYAPIPRSWSRTKKDAALRGEVVPGRGAGDRGNHLKLVEDALQGVIYADDAQIVSGLVTRIYGLRPGYLVQIAPWDPLLPPPPPPSTTV